MSNHVHLIVKPEEVSNLSRSIGERHRRHMRRINFREQWRGFLWQGQFASFPMNVMEEVKIILMFLEGE